MARNDKARQARRTEYIITLHEASHQVAAWMLGLSLGSMKFCECTDYSEGFSDRDRLSNSEAACENDIPFSEMLAASVGERYVHASRYAFVELAGVFGCSNDFRNDRHQTLVHCKDAATAIAKLLDKEEDIAVGEVKRLIPVVIRAFADPRIQTVTRHLARIFLERRSLTGAECTQIIEQAWNVELVGAATAGVTA
jgi:hypothetical protein